MIAVYGWGAVAPGARNVTELRRVVAEGKSALALAPEIGLGRRLFMVGDPAFDFEDYRPWIEARGGAPRFTQLRSKMGDNALFAIGATIQALECHPGLEAAVRAADQAAHVYIGSGVGDIPETVAADNEFRRAARAWYRFWADPRRNHALARYRETGEAPAGAPPPPDPLELEVDSEERFAARERWDAYWAGHNEALRAFEERYAAIEGSAPADVETTSLDALKARQRLQRKLVAEVGCPTPPWIAVDPRLLWAIQNVPAAQVSMLLGLHGPALAAVGACSTFGVALKLGCDAITRGEAKVAILGTTDPRRHPALVSAFHRARLVPGSGQVNHPLTGLLGTHVAGGACVWIIADTDYMTAHGVAPVGPEIGAVALSSDAEHIITPSLEGPKNAIRRAMAAAPPEGIAAWDLHATGTPGDLSELGLLREFLSPRSLISARKGIFGHGMSNAGGWELTALAMEVTSGRALPSAIPGDALHPAIAREHGQRLAGGGQPLPGETVAKLMLGIGGITACVVLRGGGETKP
jgi:3-oxoacyl-(acyl-carrier-protein) synthase